jgi:Dna[CI] antecedent, DciA
MESASRIFGKLAAADRPISPEQLVISAWPGAVGKRIAVHARAAKMVRTRLVVEVEDEIWQRQLFVMTRQILANLESKVGRGIVDELYFKIVPRRIDPQRAPMSLFSQDEADQIKDPVMRHIFKAARDKAVRDKESA